MKYLKSVIRNYDIIKLLNGVKRYKQFAIKFV